MDNGDCENVAGVPSQQLGLVILRSGPSNALRLGLDRRVSEDLEEVPLLKLTFVVPPVSAPGGGGGGDKSQTNRVGHWVQTGWEAVLGRGPGWRAVAVGFERVGAPAAKREGPVGGPGAAKEDPRRT